METQTLLNQLDEEGIIILQDFIHHDSLVNMQNSFNNKLKNMSFNSTNGFQRYEKYRYFVEDLMMVDKSFVEFAVNPILMQIVRGYISENAIIKECRGWRTKITKEQIQLWHKDGWYDKNVHKEPPKQLKVVIYLTDVDSGSFAYIKGSHRSVKSDAHVLHQHFNNEFVEQQRDKIVYVTGKAGTVAIFDVSGVHCQSSPNLSNRHAVFYSFNDPEVVIDKSELEYGRYSPLILRNEFIDDSYTIDDLKFLGFFQKQNNHNHVHQELTRYPWLSLLARAAVETAVYWDAYIAANFNRVVNRIKKTYGH